MMDTVKEVQVRACKLEHEDDYAEVVWSTESDAAFFSVYTGEPGGFIWDADFGDKAEALHFAKMRAMRFGAVCFNRIGEL